MLVELADKRFDHAEAAGRIAEIKRKIEAQETLLIQALDNEKTLLEEGRQLKADWALLWKGVSIEPEAPDTMLEWLEDRVQVLEAVEARDEAESALEAAQTEEREARKQLIGELIALGVDVGTLESDALTIVVERAAEELRIREVEANRKSQLTRDVAVAGKLVSSRERDLESANTALTEWQEKWAAALVDLGLDANTAAEAVDAQIGIIDQMRETAGRINSLRHDRIEKIKRDVADFDDVVSRLMKVVAADLADEETDEVATALEMHVSYARATGDISKTVPISSHCQKACLRNAVSTFTTDLSIANLSHSLTQPTIAATSASLFDIPMLISAAQLDVLVERADPPVKGDVHLVEGERSELTNVRRRGTKRLD